MAVLALLLPECAQTSQVIAAQRLLLVGKRHLGVLLYQLIPLFLVDLDRLNVVLHLPNSLIIKCF